MIQTAALYWFAKTMTYSASVIETAAKYSHIWLLGHTDLAGSSGPNYASIDATIAQIRAVNPRAWIGLYVGGLAFKSEIDPPALWLTDADLLHRPDGSPLSWLDSAGVFSGGDAFTYRLPNLGSSAVQDKLIAGYVQFAQQHHLDGILIDGYDPAAYAAYVANAAGAGGMFGCPTGCIEGAWHQTAPWTAALGAVGDRLRWSLEQVGCSFVFNGIHGYPGVDLTPKLEHASGAMMEGLSVVRGDAPTFVAFIDQVGKAVVRRRSVFMLASPWHTQPQGQEAERFYLGLGLLVQEPPYTSFGYSPYVPYRAWDGDDPSGHPSGNPAVFWSPDWDLDYGYPLGPCMIGTPVTVAWREYSRCYVVVNPTNTYQQMGLVGTFRLWHPTTGYLFQMTPTANILNIPPREAWVLFKVSA